MKGMRKRHRKRLTAVFTAVALICTGGVLPENVAYAAEQTEEGVAIDKENFPDENLRNYLKESGFDKNDDGYFSQSELDAVEEMEATYNKLENLKGLEYFRNLKSLDIRLNNISGELDLQLFPNLTSVYCDDNEITSIRFGENCKLELIGCNYNQIEVLDVSGLDHLDQLVCTGNPLKVLKFNEKWTSIRLYCDECSLTSLKIPESLDASETQINCENNVTYLTQKNIDFLDPEMFPDFDTGKIQKVVKLTKEQEEAGKSGTDIFDELKGSDYKLTDLQLGDRIIYTYDCGMGMSFDFTVHVGYSEEMFPPNRPDGTQYVEYTVSTVGEVPLPEGWKWKDEDADLALPFGNWYEATAEYVGDNAEYYANIYQDVEIWKDYCQHPNDMWELKDEQEADCTQSGYTGDYYCGVCGNLLYKGEYIPIQHRLELVEEKEATQTEPGNIQYFVCSACGKLFLDEDGYHEVGIEDVTIPVLEPDPTDEPVPAPSEDPTAEPTKEPNPTEAPLPTPGVSETPVPTEEPTPAPSEDPTTAPSEKPTAEPTREPEITPEPTTAPAPSEEPTTTPMPSEEPTMAPSEEPTMAPMPSEDPTMEPTAEPTEEPKPTEAPLPTPGVSETPVPTEEPTPVPTEEPTTMPSEEPTREPAKTAAPIEPTKEPVPTDAPVPTEVPTQKPEVPEITPEPIVPAVPTVVPPVRTPVPTQTVQATQTPATPAPTPVSTPKTNRKKPAKVGKIITSSAGYRFKVTSSKVKNPEVALYRPGSGRKEVKIGTKVTINGISYSVTSVCERAFRSNKRVKKVSLGSRVDKIGKEAFANCRNIKVLYIYSPRLKASDIGENAFKGINKRVKISVPKAKMKEYKELFCEKGLSKQTSVTTGKVQ